MQPSTINSCCESPSAQTATPVFNQPGLSAVAYRVGTHSQFKQRLLDQLAKAGPALRSFTARQDGDFTIGLLDAWSTVADVLTFYQERIANESYLRTATERFSVLEMARLIGYELQPGVAASTYLAFTLDDIPGAFAPQLVPGTAYVGQQESPAVTIAAGTRVQSVPGPGEQAQTFETTETLEAHAGWNAMKPRLTQPQSISISMNLLVLEGTANGLKPGDVLFIRESTSKLRRIQKVTINETARTTHIDLIPEVDSKADLSFRLLASTYSGTGKSVAAAKATAVVGQISNFLNEPFLNQSVVTNLLQTDWSEGDLAALTAINNWSAAELSASFAAIQALFQKPAENGVYVFRKRAFFFGYNAPLNLTYPTDKPSSVEGKASKAAPGFTLTFPVGEFISGIKKVGKVDWTANETATKIFLDAAYDELLPGGIIAIQGDGEPLEQVNKFLTLKQVDVQARTEYGLSTKTTALTVTDDWRSSAFKESNSLADLRNLTIYAQNETLKLAEIPINDNVTGGVITLDRYYPGLQPGQNLLLIGKRIDSPGSVTSELLTLQEATMTGGFTVLRLQSLLLHAYVPDSVTINGNVALATHGETVRETLGSGNASQVFQRFVLRQPPLTYQSGDTTNGAATTLEIRVNDILWHEVPTFLECGPQDRVYITRLDNEGKTTVMFGDGITGARLPTGSENVKARYRKGMGLSGLVKENQLSQLVSRPLGVKGVNNPLEASGAADRETLDDARRNAPLQILTLGRIVSLQDYADFARSFAGIDKALATWSWIGQQRQVFVTVAGAGNTVVKAGSQPHDNLLKAIRKAADPNVSVTIASYRPVYFRLVANVKVAPDYLPEKVLTAVDNALKKQFSFAARDFGQSVIHSAVVAAIQKVPGVVAVEFDALYRIDQESADLTTGLTRPLEAQLPRPNGNTVFAAELLMIDSQPVDLRPIL